MHITRVHYYLSITSGWLFLSACGATYNRACSPAGLPLALLLAPATIRGTEHSGLSTIGHLTGVIFCGLYKLEIFSISLNAGIAPLVPIALPFNSILRTLKRKQEKKENVNPRIYNIDRADG